MAAGMQGDAWELQAKEEGKNVVGRMATQWPRQRCGRQTCHLGKFLPHS